MRVSKIATDLRAEHEALDEVVSHLTSEQWNLATPSPRWTVAHQIAHLTYFDRSAVVAITDPPRFSAMVSELWTVAAQGDGAADELTMSSSLELGSEALLNAWRDGCAELCRAAEHLDEETRVAWYGPPMSGQSFLTARLMETWAHGQDIVDAVGADRPVTDRIRHVAQLGYITRGWSFTNRGEVPPATPVRVDLTSPSGETWTWGPDDAEESVRGEAVDFCLVVTQRRHLEDTGLRVIGPGASAWLTHAQAFAGPPTDGPAPGRFI